SFSEFVIFIVVNVFYTLLFYKLTQRTLEKKG
ncbi:ABC transporter permease, partial [Streptococcus mutans]|nr:ABC transporter permease [Streptococcus mutans]